LFSLTLLGAVPFLVALEAETSGNMFFPFIVRKFELAEVGVVGVLGGGSKV